MRINISFNYRSSYQYLLKSFALIIMIGWASSCDNDDSATPSLPDPDCILVTLTSSTTGKQTDAVTFTSSFKHVLIHNQSGNVTGFTSSYEYKTSDGFKSSSNTNRIYEYDKNNFVQKFVMQETRIENGSSSYTNYNHAYEYDKERLVKQTIETTTGNQTRIAVYLYEYDASGKVTKFYNRDTNAGVQIEYLGSRVSKITLTDETGQVRNPYVEYSDKGLLLKSVITTYGDTDERRFEYDVNDLMTRSEQYHNTEPLSAFTYEYDAQQNPDNQIAVMHKGHPVIPSVNPHATLKHNVTKRVTFSPDDKENWEVKSSTVSSYTYNSKGFPTNVTAKEVDKNGAEISTNTISYEYEGCQ